MVIADDDRIDGRYLEVHQGILSLLALQAPVAGDLRLVAALLHVIKHIERMGDQCVNIAKLVPLAGHEPPADAAHARRHPADGRPGPPAGGPVQAGLRSAATWRWRRTWCARTTRSTASTSDVFHLALEIGDDPDTREWAMHMMLVARCIERIGDNAVDIGEQTAFVVTGLFREFEDASHPELARRRPLLDLRLHRHRQQHHPAAGGGRGQRAAARARHPARLHADRQEPRDGGADPAGEDRRDRRGGGTQATVAREVGAEQIVAVATAAIRNAPNRERAA